jgi:hypothetical protein
MVELLQLSGKKIQKINRAESKKDRKRSKEVHNGKSKKAGKEIETENKTCFTPRSACIASHGAKSCAWGTPRWAEGGKKGPSHGPQRRPPCSARRPEGRSGEAGYHSCGGNWARRIDLAIRVEATQTSKRWDSWL